MPSRPSVLFVNQHYWPDVAATGQMLTDLAEWLAADGFEVHVLAGRSGYGGGPGELQAGADEERNGVIIHRVRTTAFGRGRHIGRLADYASFYSGALAHVMRRRYDLVVYLTTPPLLPTLGAMARKARGSRYGIWSMDLHPDAEEALGLLRKGSAPARALHALNNRGYRNADVVVALGPYMARRIEGKGVDSARVREISVWGGRDEVQPVAPEDNPLRAELGLEDAFVVMYSGNAGLAHRFDEVKAAMVALRDDPRIQFVFAGGGPRRSDLEAFAEAEGLTNVRFLEYFPREQLSEALSLADIHLLTLRPDMAGIAVPSKLFGAMAAARPTAVVAPAASEPAEIVRQHEAGIVVHPGENGLADKLTELADHPERGRAMGERARHAFLETYERDTCCAAWSRLLTEVIEPTPEGAR